MEQELAACSWQEEAMMDLPLQEPTPLILDRGQSSLAATIRRHLKSTHIMKPAQSPQGQDPMASIFRAPSASQGPHLPRSGCLGCSVMG